MKYFKRNTLLNRNVEGFVLFLAFLLITGCKTQQQTPSAQPLPEKKSDLTAAEKDRLLQSEYKPAQSAKMDKGQIDSLANEKAGLICKKKNYEKMIRNGEQFDSQNINFLDDMIAKLESRIAEKSRNPPWLKYFNEKFNEFMKSCDN